ncbi:MAG: hypothetical protein DRO15_08185 [Thermoprotei archaeon]|nr:MAG: hypothetical protein DRO15_08185 [Thermoprotei archaeon]
MRYIQKLLRIAERVSEEYIEFIKSYYIVMKHINTNKQLRSILSMKSSNDNSPIEIIDITAEDYIREVRKFTCSRFIISFVNVAFNLLYRYIRAESDFGELIAEKRLEGFENCSGLVLKLVSQLLMNPHFKTPIFPITNIQDFTLDVLVFRVLKEMDIIKERTKKNFLTHELGNRIELVENSAECLKQLVTQNLNFSGE